MMRKINFQRNEGCDGLPAVPSAGKPAGRLKNESREIGMQ